MPQQLDIFNDSRDVVLRNDLARAVLDGDPDAAQRIADTLRAEFGNDRMLEPAAVLIEQLRRQQSLTTTGPCDAPTVLDLRQRLDGAVAAAANTVLGPRAAAGWLDSQWHWLAGQASGIDWNPAHADAHAAALYLRARAWPQAIEAVARIESWRRIPLPLLWMAQARWNAEGADAGWPLLAEALWLAPKRTATLIRTLPDTRRHLGRLIDRFEECFEPDEAHNTHWAWLPAFVLVEQPLLDGPLKAATPPPDSAPGTAFKTLQSLLRLEGSGRQQEIKTTRQRLKDLSSPLFEAYMATR